MKKLRISVVGWMIALMLASALRAQAPLTQGAAEQDAPFGQAASPTPVFLRFTNHSDDQEPFSWWMFVYHAQATANAFANAGMLTPTGFTEQYVFPAEPERQLTPGQTTEWVEITKYLRASADQPPGGLDSVQLIATRGTHVSGFVQGRVRGTFEFAVGPDKRVVKTIEVDQAGPRLWLSLAHDIRGAGDIRTAFEFIRANEAALDKVRPLHGRPAVHMDVTTGLNLEAGVDDPAVIEAEIALLRRMGFNNVWEPAAPPEEAEAFNERMGLAPRFGLTLHFFHNQGSGDHCTNVPLLPAEQAQERARELAEESAAILDKVVRVVIADEPAGMTMEHMIRHDADRKLFAEELREQGHEPEDLGVASWDQVAPVPEEDHLRRPELWYHTVMFNLRSTNRLTRRSVDIARRYLPKHANMLVNYVPPLGYGDWIATGADPFMMQRDGGLDMGWTEDWRAGGVSPQHISDSLAMLRAAGRFEQPLGAYMVAVDSPPPILRLKYYGLLAGGARQFNVYNYGPAYASVDVWGTQHEIYPVIAAVQHEMGVIDEALRGAERVRSDIAILYNRTASVWAAAGRTLTTQLDGRFARWALNHAGYDAEFIAEEDVEAGGLHRYKVLYLTGLQIRPESARSIAEWVEGGGVLFATAGAGTRDHYNRPLDTLDPVFGARSRELRVEEEVGTGPRYQLGSLRVLGDVTAVGEGVPRVSFDRLCIQETLEPSADARVILQAQGGEPGGVMNAFGKGTAIRVAALPGIAYASDALRKDFNAASDDLPRHFRRELRDLLVWPAQLAGTRRIGESNAPACEIARYDGPDRAVVFVVDYSGTRTQRFVMTLPDAGQFKRAYTATGKPVELRPVDGGALEVSFALEATDAVVLEK